MNYLVVGYKTSGKSAAQLLKSKGHKVYVYDSNITEKENAIKDGFGFVTKLNSDFLKQIELCVVSPGIKPNSEIIKKIKSMNIKIIGELELGYVESRAKVAAITGTNGKTTAVSLLSWVCGKKAALVGNVGCPITSYTKAKNMIVEVSSFQLETIDKFRPNVAGITYIDSDHIDYHGSLENYINAKYKIAQNMRKKDKLVLNAEDENCMKLALKCGCKIWTFSSKHICKGAYINDGKIFFIKNIKPKYIMDVKDIKLLGGHNLDNVLLVVTMASLMGINAKTIARKISTFRGLKHRIEKVACLEGITYINDSKATNISATKVAVDAVKNNIILLIGGQNKGYEFDELFRNLEVKKVIIFGEAKKEIESACKRQHFDNYIVCDYLKDAVCMAKTIAKEGDNVLLSPACSSHDEFLNYEQRGEKFEEYVFAE